MVVGRICVRHGKTIAHEVCKHPCKLFCLVFVGNDLFGFIGFDILLLVFTGFGYNWSGKV